MRWIALPPCRKPAPSRDAHPFNKPDRKPASSAWPTMRFDMRILAFLTALSLGASSALAAEEPSGCDKFKWPIEHERAALTAPDRAKLASGSEQAALPSTGHHAGAGRAREAKLPTPPERAPKDGTFAGFTSIKAPKAGLYTVSLSSGRLGRRGPGRAFPQARGLQRRDRLRRHPQDHEIRAVGAARSCSRSAAPRTIRSRSRSCRRNRPNGRL